MSDFITINNRKIGVGEPPYIIAEMSANHGGDIRNAFRIIEEAKKAGADALKMQTYTPQTITLKSDMPDFQITNGLWEGRSLYDLYEEAHTPWDWHGDLFSYAAEKDITIFSSPFDKTAVDLLERLGAPAYKIASFEIVDHALIAYAAQTKKPLLISTGMANYDEIGEAIAVAKDNGCQELVILHCVSSYPAKASEYNLRTLVDIGDKFDVLTGLSDHTIDNLTALASVAMGACLIEKHFTLDRTAGGPDDSFSLEPQDLKSLCHETKRAWEALGHVTYQRTRGEADNLKFRRSLYFVCDIKQGQEITSEMVRSVRPGYGMSPKYLSQVIGCTAQRDIQKHTPVTSDAIMTHSDNSK